MLDRLPPRPAAAVVVLWLGSVLAAAWHGPTWGTPRGQEPVRRTAATPLAPGPETLP